MKSKSILKMFLYCLLAPVCSCSHPAQSNIQLMNESEQIAVEIPKSKAEIPNDINQINALEKQLQVRKQRAEFREYKAADRADRALERDWIGYKQAVQDQEIAHKEVLAINACLQMIEEKKQELLKKEK